jgi:phosphomannomutase
LHQWKKISEGFCRFTAQKFASMTAIKFGTDGWRGIIAQDFTFENLRRAALAAASYFKNHPNVANGVCVGYDTRFLSEQFARFVAEIFSSQGLKVFLADTFTPTPAVSLFVRDKRLAGGIVITASHNPPHYNGFKVKAEYGGSAHPETIAVIERHLSSIANIEKVKANPTLIELAPVRRYYRDYLANELNLTAIAQSGWRIAHNAMFGAGQGLVAELLPKSCVVEYHCSINPTFDGINPEPIPNYIEDFVPFYKQSGCEVAILTDGDADRIGMLDEHGRFVDSHKIFSLLLKYLVEEQGKRGEVACTYALTQVINKICAKHALTVHNLPIGFKHVGKLMTTRDILIGGEESGGIGITAHLPERDGIYIGLLVTEVMARRKKKLSELVEELYQEYGYFTYERVDAKLSESQKATLMHEAAQGNFKEIDGMRVTRFENLDGYKYYFEGGWLLIRASGTEPIVRLYSEADSEEKVSRALAFAQSLAGLTVEKT